MLAFRLVPILLMSCLPMGCASWPFTAAQNDISADDGNPAQAPLQVSPQALRLIALDFVSALRQMESLQPAKTTVHLLSTSHSDAFTLTMEAALQQAGYAVRWVSDASSGELFQYRYAQTAAQPSGYRATFEVAVGDAELRRSYQTDGRSAVEPITPLYVRGVDASGIVLDDAHFVLAEPADGLEYSVAPLLSKPEVSWPQESASGSAITPLAVPREANPLNPLVSGVKYNQGLTLPLTDLTRVENVFDLGESNFEDLLANHRVAEKLILLFPNDSLRLGEVNKSLVEQMVRSYRPATDVFSVIGCSLGPTQLSSGNAALALGRASRVREALLFAGIPPERILDEGCWAGDGSNNSLPRRGVVVTLNRK